MTQKQTPTSSEKSLFEKRYEDLNPEQRHAVDTIDGPVMVVAGPGSGKTEILGLRVANILRNRDLYPGNILCLTFTDAAAANMRNRLVGLLGSDAYRVAIHTFHSFGVETINRYPERFYGGAQFAPADSVTQIEILEEIFNGLDHGDPLRSQHDDKFVHLRKTLTAIAQIKKAGLTPDDFEKILSENKKAIEFIEPIVQAVFGERVSKKMFEPAYKAAAEIGAFTSTRLPQSFTPFAEYFSKSLEEALAIAETEGTGALTTWKGDYTKRGDDKLTHVADFLDMDKFTSLASIYRQYVTRMHKEGYYDYDDMILDTIAMLEKNSGVRYELQERYQYVLVDEFQDTNNAQMRILQLLTDNPIHEGRPNIMVVGDDDQAVYKFQGAEISNIIDFSKVYRDPEVIILKSNYRSTQPIVDAARRVIAQGRNRLERMLPAFKKELIAANKDIKPGAIQGKEFPSRDAEYQWIAGEANELREKKGIKKIAVIAREHKELEALVPYFHSSHIPVAYEREENVLRSSHVLQLITMARFVDSIMRKSDDADDLLPEILSYPFWGIDRSTVWEISITAGHERKPWMMVMRQKGGTLKEIADFFIELGAKAKYATAEEILHELMGGPELVMAEENDDDETPQAHEMFSPFRSYYFGEKQFKEQRAEYLHFLSSLQSFVKTLREYRPGKTVSTEDMLIFVDTHIKNNLPINNVSQFTNGNDAVQFMTAHKAKGLEFEAVFVLNCENDVWVGKGKNRDMSLPTNLPIGPAGDDRDDQLRLFYVAITRAQRLLYFTSSKSDSRGKSVDQLEFLAPAEGESEWLDSEVINMEAMGRTPEDMLMEQWSVQHIGSFAPDEKALLAPLLERYQLSVTHLKNFLDVVSAGPAAFLEKNLLMFPGPKTASSGFGSAVHATIKSIYAHLKEEGKQPPLANVLVWFQEALKDERLNKDDFERMLKRGNKLFEVYYPEKKDSFSPDDVIEFDFKNQGVVLGDAHLTGKVDRMTFVGDTAIVCDFKTSKTITAWERKDLFENIKAWEYRHQIVFYKLLIENSREYGHAFSVTDGFIEFVEPYQGHIFDLPMKIEPEEVDRLKLLIGVVFKKIQALDFPDVSQYSKDIKGIHEFEDDLLNGKI
jgi:DNA helicase-2/ATP-dependent DNA helicase PcrA